MAIQWIVVVALCWAGAAAGEDKPDARLQEAQTAYDKARTLLEAGKYAEAIELGEHALALREAVLGATHSEVADCLELLGRLRQYQSDLDRAEPLIRRGLAIREAALGKTHPDVASSLNNLANLYLNQRLYNLAEPLYQRSLAIRESAFGKTSPEVAKTLGNLARLYTSQQLYSMAEPLFLRAIAILEATLGKNHPDIALLLKGLADLYRYQALYDRAEPLYKRTIALQEAALGKNHPDVASSLNNLANLYAQQSLYNQAEPLYQRALAIREASLGINNPEVASTLGNLALIYWEQGLYERVEPLHLRELAIMRAAFGENHPEVASTLDHLANLYLVQGSYSKAQPLQHLALAIREAALGKNHPDVASSLNNIAASYADQGLYSRAEPLFERAIAIREAALGKNHPDVALSLSNLAACYSEHGLYSRADPLFQRALAIREAALGKNHPDVASSLSLLAISYQKRGLYSRADTLQQRALDIFESALGENHPYVASSLTNLALLQLAQHHIGAAVNLSTRVLIMSERRLRKESLDFSEARMGSFLQLLRNDEGRLYALLRAHLNNTSVRRLALSAAFLIKGRSVEHAADISRAVYHSLGPNEHDTFYRLRALRTELAMLSLNGPGSQALPAYRQQLLSLTEQGDALEADLAKRSAPLRALNTLPSPADIVSRVAEALPKDGALLEFITYVDRPLVPKPGAPEQHLRYLALVLFADSTIRAQDLGPAEPIDIAVSRLHDALANSDVSVEADAQALYKLAFQPLVPLLGNKRRLFVSPDGQLSLVPFAALHDGHQYLVDTYDFTYLSSGKDLLPRPQETATASSVVVLADPDFSAPLSATIPSLREAPSPAERSASLERFFSTPRSDLADQPWAPLPGTRQEAKAIQTLYPQAQLLLGTAATKDALLKLPTPGLLHIATHGFFLEDSSTPKDSRAVKFFGAVGDAGPQQPLPDPLLRSGLIFAGARPPSPSPGSSPQAPPQSSLATALELAGLNLWGTQLVVLSACDTGQGDVKLGQGVYGLRRAFMIAGAETVVMSLWKINDDTTSQLMESYYRNLLAGQGRTASLRQAMLSLRDTHPHPHDWAPFISLGKDSPLRSVSP